MSKRKEVVSLYAKEVERLPAPAQNTAQGVLYAVVVATGLQCREDNKALVTNAMLKPALPSEYDGDRRLEQSGPNTTFRGLVRAISASPEQPQPVVKVEKSDAFTVPYIQAVIAGSKSSQKIPESEIDIHVSLEGLNRFHKYALLQTAVQRLLQINASVDDELLGRFPVAPTLSATERSLLETELLTFTDLGAADTFKYNQLQKLDEFVTKYVSPPPNFSTTFYASQGGSKASNISLIDENSVLKRKFARLVSSVLLPQIISQQLVKEPIILGRYYEMTDQLLYALVWRPVDRRIRLSTWSHPEGYRDLAPEARGVETVGQKGGHAAVVMTPAGQSLVHARYSFASREGWLSIYVDGGVVGYRPVRQIAAPALVVGEAPTSVAEDAAAPEDEEAPAAPEVKEAPAALEEKEAPAAPEEKEAPAAPEVKAVPKPQAKAKAAAPVPTPTFFFQAEEGCRMLVTHSAAPSPCAKPDKQGTVCLTACAPSGLQVSVSSGGAVCMNVQSFSAYRSRERKSADGAEARRFVLTGGALVRHLDGGVFSRDVLLPSGARVLYRDKRYSKELKGFHKKLFKAGPADWSHVALGADGSVVFYVGEVAAGTPSAELCRDDMCSTSTDAQTRAKVSTFLDGRFLIKHTDGLTELLLTDDTRLVTYPSGAFVILSKPLLPTVEVDVEVDKMCEAHSRGQQISLAKSGLVVRKRIVMPDGAACFVKYDTRVTSRVNGSLVLVKRDRATIVATDDGKATYSPRASWTAQAQAAFARDCADPSPGLKGVGRSTAPQGSFAAEASLSLAEGSAAHASASSLLEPSHMSSVTNATAAADSAGVKTDKAGKKMSVPKGDSRATPPGYKNTSVSDVPSLPENAGTKFVVDLANYSCTIEDYECNCFSIDLRDPLKSTVALAGEVEGLKPTAVADVPVDPKLFVISRSLDAVEYVSNGDFKSAEGLRLNCPDVSLYTSATEGQPSDLNSTGTQYNFFTKLVAGLSEDDSYSFQETFAEREWQSRPVPPTAALQQMRLREAASRGKAGAAPAAVAGKAFELLSLLETMPLSTQGYAQLSHGFERYDDFLAYRQRSMDSFAVADDRSFEEKEAEDLMSIRIQKVYQKVKNDAKKNKKSHSQVGTSMLLEAINSADEFDDDEGLPLAEGPLEAELLESFDSYAVASPDPEDPSVRVAAIAFDDLRTALIQVLNANVTNTAIVNLLRRTNKEYVNMYYDDAYKGSFPPLSYADFKSLYYHIVDSEGAGPAAKLKPLAATVSSDSNSYSSDSGSNIRMNKTAPHKLQLNDMMSSIDSAASGSGINAVRKYK